MDWKLLFAGQRKDALIRLCILIQCEGLCSYRKHSFKLLMLAFSYMIPFQRMSCKHFQSFHLSHDAFGNIGKKVFTLGMMAPSTTHSCFQISNTLPRTHTASDSRCCADTRSNHFNVSLFLFTCAAAVRLGGWKGPVPHVLTEETGGMFSPDCSPVFFPLDKQRCLVAIVDMLKITPVNQILKNQKRGQFCSPVPNFSWTD